MFETFNNYIFYYCSDHISKVMFFETLCVVQNIDDSVKVADVDFTYEPIIFRTLYADVGYGNSQTLSTIPQFNILECKIFLN